MIEDIKKRKALILEFRKEYYDDPTDRVGYALVDEHIPALCADIDTLLAIVEWAFAKWPHIFTQDTIRKIIEEAKK